MKKRFLKTIALFVAFIFLATSVDPSAFATVSASPELSSLVPHTLSIPAELGEVTETAIGDPLAPVFIHIQSAHGNYEAERNIESLLAYIGKNSSVKLTLLEGAAGNLRPELFRIFPEHSDFNRKVTDKLMQEGYLTGPERFLIENEGHGKSSGYETRPVAHGPWTAFGVEDLEAYKKDRAAFISVVKSDKPAQAFLMKLRASLDKRFASKLNKDLLNLVRQEEAFASGVLSFEVWLKVLREASKKQLRQDLSDAFYQDKYPFLVRYDRLQTIGAKIDQDKAMKEFDGFIKELEKRNVSKEIVQGFRATDNEGQNVGRGSWAVSRDEGYSVMRRAFENAFEKLPKDFSMKAWPHWTLYAQHIILMQEMEGKGLRDETLLLRDEIQKDLARTPEEKEYLTLARELYLFRRLFALELTRTEYEELQLRGTEIAVLGKSDVGVVFKKALNFYDLAVIRENKMFVNALRRMGESKEQRAVIVTGGFHAEGLKKLAASKGCSYFQISPRITEVSKRDHEVYLKAMLGSRDFQTSQIPALLGTVPEAERVAVTGEAQTRTWRSDLRSSITSMIHSEPVLAQPELRRAFARFRSGSSSEAFAPGLARSEVRGPAVVLERAPYADTKLRIAMAQMNPKVGDMVGNYNKALEFMERAKAEDVDIITLPELAITGYLPEDLLHKQHFVRQNKEFVELFASKVRGITAIIGFVDYDAEGHLYNAAAVCADGKIQHIYHKWDLPNYITFDEKRYFTPGTKPLVFTVKGIPIGLHICEDSWNKRGPGMNVYEEAVKLGAKIQINISASPSHIQKMDIRRQMLTDRVNETGSIFVYNNLVGGQDEVVFDGGDMIMVPGGKLLAKGHQFQEELIVTDVDARLATNQTVPPASLPVIAPASNSKQKLPLVAREIPEALDPTEESYHAIVLAIRDYMRKNGFKKIILGLSGGIDSAVVAALAVAAIGKENVKCISMPTRFNSARTKNDARITADRLGVEFKEMPIQGIFSFFLGLLTVASFTWDLFFKAFGRWLFVMPYAGHFFKRFAMAGFGTLHVPEENLQARIRGMILMYESNKSTSADRTLVATTGNKSEVGVGYCTLYGDMAGGFAPIKDSYKTQVFDLARFINKKEGSDVIPVTTIDGAPSAELNENQKDEDALPPYVLELDPMLKLLLEKNAPTEDLAVVGGMFKALTELNLYSKKLHRRFADVVFKTGDLTKALHETFRLDAVDEELLKLTAQKLGMEKAKKVIRLVDIAEYKRRQGPPGPKLTPLAFGRDRRMPITNGYNEDFIETFLTEQFGRPAKTYVPEQIKGPARKIGIFGGTFNPITKAGLAVAEAARQKLGLDEVIFVPTNKTPDKSSEGVVPGGVRLQMLLEAIRPMPAAFRLSGFEVRRDGDSFTVDTIQHFRDKYPEGSEFFMIVGADRLPTIPKWKEAEALLKRVKVVAVTFEESPIPPVAGIEAIPLVVPDAALKDLHATLVREMISSRTPGWEAQVAPGTAMIIQEQGLYSVRSEIRPGETAVVPEALQQSARQASHYQQLSRASAEDKERVLRRGIVAEQGNILQIGLWDESVTDLLISGYPAAHFVGLDRDPRYLTATAEKHPSQELLLRNIVNWPDYYLYKGKFDTVVLGATFHSIYFTEGPAKARQALELIAGLLKPGGRLILRDGIRPDEGMRTVSFRNPDALKAFVQFVKDFKGNRQGPDQSIVPVQVFDKDGGVILDLESHFEKIQSVSLRAKDLYEFLVKYPYYGTGTWQHEMVSSFGDVSEKEYLDFTKSHFEVIEEKIYRSGYFEEHWAHDIAVQDGKDLPQSHIALILQKKQELAKPQVTEFLQQGDFIVVGSGIAGLQAALSAAARGKKVKLITKGTLRQANTEYAQGGIAAVTDPTDTFADHIADTHKVGAGITDPEAVRILVEEGAERVKELIAMGVPFDHKENGELILAQEGGHGRPRVLRAGGDATGREIERVLAERVAANPHIEIFEEMFVTDILTKDGTAYGVKAVDIKTGKEVDFLAPATLLATGGYAQVYATSSNPASATGDLIAAAYHSGAEIADMEMMQFHPSTLVIPEERIVKNPLIPFLPVNFLVSEAVRGAGGKLVNVKGEYFMKQYDPREELASRDIVARAIFDQMQKTGSDHVFLDVSRLHDEETKKPITFKERFPTIYARCLEMGLDPDTEPMIPVAPAAHYSMGGIKTDVNARTNIQGLYAAGEVSRVGVHGGNRLASNSLLEGLVFGHRSALDMIERAKSQKEVPVDIKALALSPGKKVFANNEEASGDQAALKNIDRRMRALMSQHAAIIRNERGLKQALKGLKLLEQELASGDFQDGIGKKILLGKLLVSRLIVQGALDRTESRGAHFRSDYPELDPDWKKANIQSHPAVRSDVRADENVARLNQARPKGYPLRNILTRPFYVAKSVIKNARGDKNPFGWAHPDLDDPKLKPADRRRIIEEIRASILRFAPDTNFDPVTGLPVNDEETGMRGRGLLGHYGPNQAEDSVVLRYNKKGELEILVVKRKDGGIGWALPGGFAKTGEEALVGETAKRELEQETTFDLDMTRGTVVYDGKSMDWRDTNDSWIITRGMAVLLSWKEAQYFRPKGKDDAKKAKWVKLTDDLQFYAGHRKIVDNAVAMIKNGQLAVTEDIVNLKNLDISLTDLEEAYQLFMEGKHEISSRSFDILAPKAPHGGNLLVMAGLEETLASINRRQFMPEHIEKLRKLNIFSEEFLQYLLNFKNVQVDIDALREGTTVTADIPLMRVTANPVEMALLKGLIKNRMGHSVNIATKTARIAMAANGEFVTDKQIEELRAKYGPVVAGAVKAVRALLDFGLRRGQGRGSMIASLAMIIGGAIATSNVKAAKQFWLNPSGTMAHLFISFFPPEDEIKAFRIWGKHHPKDSVFLIDTYDTIEAAKKVVIVAKEMEKAGGRLFGVRLDSGNLTTLSQEVRKIFDDAGLHYVKIFASDDLDEFKITELLAKGARIDGFGVGTNAITGGKQATLELTVTESNGERFWRAEHQKMFSRYIKTAEGRKASAKYGEDVTELLMPYWRKGLRTFGSEKPWKAHMRAEAELKQFKPENKRLENAVSIPVDVQDNPLLINPETDAIVVIDAQKAFMKTGGLSVAGGDAIMPYVRALMNKFLKTKRFASLDKHPKGHFSWASSYTNMPAMTYLTYDMVKDWTEEEHRLAPRAKFTLAELKAKLKTNGAQMLWPDHAGYGTFEAKLHPDLLPNEFEYVLTKGMEGGTDSYSAFYDNDGKPTGLTLELKKRGIKRVFVVGLAYDYCVGWSAEGAVKDGFEVIMVKDQATKSVAYPPDSIQKMDESLRSKNVPIVSAKDVLDANEHAGVTEAMQLKTPEPHPDFPEEEESTAFEEDMYHLAMCEVFFKENLHEKQVTFNYFIRGKDPIITSGLRQLLKDFQDFRFTEEQIEYLKHIHELSSAAPLDPGFIEYLRNYRYKGNILGLPEGSLAYPNEPILRAQNTIFDAIIETFVLKRRNFNSLIATRAGVVRKAYGPDVRLISDRLDGAQGAAHKEAAYSAFIGGVDATTDVDAAFAFGIPLARSTEEGVRLGADLLTGGPKAALGGVYKLVKQGRRPIVKLSDTPSKTIYPGDQIIVATYDAQGNVVRRVTKLASEKLALNPGEVKVRSLMVPFVKDGEVIYNVPDIFEVRAFREADEARFANIAATEISPQLKALQERLIQKIRGRSEVRAEPNVQIRIDLAAYADSTLLKTIVTEQLSRRKDAAAYRWKIHATIKGELASSRLMTLEEIQGKGHVFEFKRNEITGLTLEGWKTEASLATGMPSGRPETKKRLGTGMRSLSAGAVAITVSLMSLAARAGEAFLPEVEAVAPEASDKLVSVLETMINVMMVGMFWVMITGVRVIAPLLVFNIVGGLVEAILKDIRGFILKIRHKYVDEDILSWPDMAGLYAGIFAVEWLYFSFPGVFLLDYTQGVLLGVTGLYGFLALNNRWEASSESKKWDSLGAFALASSRRLAMRFGFYLGDRIHSRGRFDPQSGLETFTRVELQENPEAGEGTGMSVWTVAEPAQSEEIRKLTDFLRLNTAPDTEDAKGLELMLNSQEPLWLAFHNKTLRLVSVGTHDLGWKVQFNPRRKWFAGNGPKVFLPSDYRSFTRHRTVRPGIQRMPLLAARFMRSEARDVSVNRETMDDLPAQLTKTFMKKDPAIRSDMRVEPVAATDRLFKRNSLDLEGEAPSMINGASKLRVAREVVGNIVAIGVTKWKSWGAIARDLFSAHFQTVPRVPAHVWNETPQFAKFLAESATGRVGRSVTGQLSRLPKDKAEILELLPLVTFAEQNPKVVINLSVTGEEEKSVALLIKTLTSLSGTAGLPLNLRLQWFPDVSAFRKAYVRVLNDAGNQPMAFVTDGTHAEVLGIGSRNGRLLRVTASPKILDLTVAMMKSAVAILDARFVESHKDGFLPMAELGVQALMGELANYVAAQAKVLASA